MTWQQQSVAPSMERLRLLPCGGAPNLCGSEGAAVRGRRDSVRCCATERSPQRKDAYRPPPADLRPPPRRSRAEPPNDDDESLYEDDSAWPDEPYDAAEEGPGWLGGRGRGPPPPRRPITPGWFDTFGAGNGRVVGALLAGSFALGIGAGVALETAVTLDSDNVASSVIFDRSSPNADACAAFGASAVVMDQRIFMSFNPFNVYVTQPEVKPGCVLRRSNWNVLESRKLVDETEIADCKRHLNTFAFVGDLEKEPEVTCVFHSEQAENTFLRDPSSAVLGDGVRPRLAPDAANTGADARAMPPSAKPT